MDALFVRVLLESQAATLRMSRRKTVLRTHGMKQKTEEEDCKSARKKWKRRGNKFKIHRNVVKWPEKAGDVEVGGSAEA